MATRTKTYKNFSGGLSNLLLPGDTDVTSLTRAQNISLSKKGRITTVGGFVAHSQVPASLTGIVCPGASLFVFSSDHKTGAAAKDTGGNWLLSGDAVNHQVDFYDLTGDSFNANILDLGTPISYNPTSGATTTSESDYEGGLGNTPIAGSQIRLALGTPEFITSGELKVGDIIQFVDDGSGPNDDNIYVVVHLTDTIMTVRGFNMTDDTTIAGDAHYKVLMQMDAYYTGEAVRVCSRTGGGLTGSGIIPRRYAYVDRSTFPGLAEVYAPDNWYNDAFLGPLAPTDQKFSATDGDFDAAFATPGTGVAIGVTSNVDSGEWVAKTWVLAQTFIYDGNQESRLFTNSLGDTFTTADNDSLDVTIIADNDGGVNYDDRISGARVYIRENLSSDPWTLFADIDFNAGVRCTLSGEHKAWEDSATAGQSFVRNIDSFRLNLETYETLTGRDPSVPLILFNVKNEYWRTSVIANGRVFLGGVSYTDEGGALKMHFDQVLFSQPFEYDVFPINNVLPIGIGDAGEIVKLEFFADRLLVFKQDDLFIVNIASGNPAEWYPEATHPFKGVSHNAAVFMTPLGPAWCNQFGIFLYDGDSIIDLNKDRIEPSKHPLAYQTYGEFDASSSRVEDDSSSFATVYPFSLEAWFRNSLDGGSSLGVIVGLFDKGSNYEYAALEMKMNDGKVALLIRNTGAEDKKSSTATFNDGLWHHIVGVFTDATNRELFVDGTSVATDTSSITMSAGIDRFSVGRLARSSPVSYFLGDIATPRAWSIGLSQQNITDLGNGVPTASIGTPLVEYLPKNIGDLTWSDTSGSSLDGTATDVTAVYPDTWEHFWTDFSITMYDPRLNQLIIMKDCTGKWSRGQDYGDAWIVNLDTGAHATGRRVFAKGVVYSNPQIDWNNRLVIAEMTSFNVVNIKEWSDKPVAQAARLIVIRTIDDDFGTPGLKTIFNIVVKLKSSVAQTAAFSYAIDGKDNITAFINTAIVADDDISAAGEWTRVVITPAVGTPLTCYSFRLEITNTNSTASTMDIDEIVVQFDVEEENVG